MKKKKPEVSLSDGSEVQTVNGRFVAPKNGHYQVSGGIIPPTKWILHLCDTKGRMCDIDMLELLKALRSLVPGMMDKLWEKAKKEQKK